MHWQSIIIFLAAVGSGGAFGQSPMKISDIDSNFKMVELGGRPYTFHDYKQPPFSLSGFAWFDKDQKLCRLPQSLLSDPAINAGVRNLAWHTSGGMLRFKTDSKTIAVRARLLSSGDMSHMPRSGTSGFALYLGGGKNKKFIKTAIPQVNSDRIEAVLFNSPRVAMREFTLNFPLYNGVRELTIGLDPNARIEAPSPFGYDRPVVFYGSSVTQGGCASRPGNDYPDILARWLDFEPINMGFSGNAKGDARLAEAIASLNPAVLVMDYDYNALSAEHLRQTHEKFFKIIREKHPDLPVIIITRPRTDYGPSDTRFKIIKDTYDHAVASGDKQVFFIPGYILFGTVESDSCTVDGTHPNDFGFMRIAENILPVLRRALQGK